MRGVILFNAYHRKEHLSLSTVSTYLTVYSATKHVGKRHAAGGGQQPVRCHVSRNKNMLHVCTPLTRG
jgi:hypothetical protein